MQWMKKIGPYLPTRYVICPLEKLHCFDVMTYITCLTSECTRMCESVLASLGKFQIIICNILFPDGISGRAVHEHMISFHLIECMHIICDVLLPHGISDCAVCL